MLLALETWGTSGTAFRPFPLTTLALHPTNAVHPLNRTPSIANLAGLASLYIDCVSLGTHIPSWLGESPIVYKKSLKLSTYSILWPAAWKSYPPAYSRTPSTGHMGCRSRSFLSYHRPMQPIVAFDIVISMRRTTLEFVTMRYRGISWKQRRPPCES